MFYIVSSEKLQGPYRAKHSNLVDPVSKVGPIGDLKSRIVNLVEPVDAKTPRSKQYKSKTQKQKSRLEVGAQLMTQPVLTIDGERSADAAWKMMNENKIRHLPVVDSDDRLIGIISDRDLIGRPPLTVVHSFMTREILTASSETTLREMVTVMLDRRISCLPIVSEFAKVLGMVTRSDILKAVVSEAPLDLWA